MSMLCQFQVYSQVIHLYIYMYHIIFTFRLLQTVECLALCCTVGGSFLAR